MIKFLGKAALIEGTFPTTTLDEVLNWLESQDIIECDTETIGDCWTGHIYTIQFGNKDIQYVIDATIIDVRVFKHIFENPNKLFLFHNAKYDLKFLLALGIKPKKIYCTFLVECILTTGIEERELSLEALALRYCNVKLNKQVRGKINYVGLTDEVIKYAAEDVMCLGVIRDNQLTQLDKWALHNVANLENEVVKVFAEIEYYGMRLDPIKWLKQAEEREQQAHKYEDDLNNYILSFPDKFKKYINNQLDLFNTDIKLRKINWNSSKQVIDIFKEEGFITSSVNEKVIEKYRSKFHIVDLYLKYKENQTAISKFGKDYLKWVNKKTGRVNTVYWQILSTGRVSSGKKDEAPNKQQLPATNTVRNCFISDTGYSFVDCDYSAMELVIAGCVSEEDSWIDAFNNGYDLHSVVAAAVYKDKWVNGTEEGCLYIKSKQKCNCKEHKKMRDKTKTLNYLCIYGGGPQKLSDSINIAISEAKETVDNYFKGLPKLTTFLNKLKKFGVRNGFITTKSPYGRIRWFEPHNGDFKIISTIERQSGNTFVQGELMPCLNSLNCWKTK